MGRLAPEDKAAVWSHTLAGGHSRSGGLQCGVHRGPAMMGREELTTTTHALAPAFPGLQCVLSAAQSVTFSVHESVLRVRRATFINVSHT